MLKGIKKRFGSSRSAVRNRQRGSPGRDQGDTPPREPPDKGGYKPTSPRQVHPVGQLPPVPYARRSLERAYNSPGKTAPYICDRCPDTFCGPQSGLNPAPNAYPTSPNICVTGGKIEFIHPSDSISDGSGNSSTLVLSPASLRSPSPPPLTDSAPQLPPAPQGNKKTLLEKSLQSPPKTTPQQTPPNSSTKPMSPPKPQPATPTPTTGSTRASGRKSRIRHRNLSASSNARKNYSNSPVVGGSLNLRNKQESLRVRRSATMPEYDDTVKELEKLRKENRYVKLQLETLKKKYSKLEEHTQILQQEKEELLQHKEDKEECMEKLSQYQTLVERCSALEYANAQLQAESQVQRHQYEKCLDQVATQVVQAILVQKSQQEQCERLSKQVESLQKQNENLCTLIRAKGGGGVSLSLNHPRRRVLPFAPQSGLSSQSLSLPNTLTRHENICDNSRKADNTLVESVESSEKVSSYDLLQAPRTCSDTITPPARSSSLSSSTQSTNYSPFPDNKRVTQLDSISSRANLKGTSACWYDIIKSLQKGEGPPPEIIENCSLESSHNVSSDSSAETDDPHHRSLNPQRSILNEELSTNSSEDDYNSCSISTTKDPSSGVALSPPSTSTQSTCRLPLAGHCARQSRATVSKNDTPAPAVSPSAPEQHQAVIVNCSLTNFEVKPTDVPKLEAKSGDQKDPEGKVGAAVPVTKKTDAGSSSEVITKDEGYSTMSSDVQAEVKDNVIVCKISTVEEEKVKNTEIEEESSDQCDNKESITKDSSPNNIEISNNAKNLGHSSSVPPSNALPNDYCDGMRVVYDEEDSSSDVFLIPINDEKCFRHSFNIPYYHEPIKLIRSFSDSYLLKNRTTGYSSQPFKNNLEQTTLPSMSSLKKCLDYGFNSNLCRVFRRESVKFRKLYNKPLVELLKASSVSNDLKKSEGLPHSCESHLQILSPSYSHAEMEDWSLDLSAEDIGAIVETETSAADSTAPTHLTSQPSIQETTLELEEDTSEFLWNGATYFKAQDHELDWHYEKDQNKAWDLNLVAKEQSQCLISPKSGCSDQPAIWSSSDQLSCCSDIASKCSTDIENFCDQLCNLPELKRVSFCSSDNGRPESINSLSKLSEAESVEDNSEVTDDIAIDTVFTRDFYRLVKFESTKSLAASSKSLAMSEGFLTMEQLQGLDSSQSNKTLASVLGFIAEQQQYCKEREALDETPLSILCSKINSVENARSTSENLANAPHQLLSDNLSNLNNNDVGSKQNLNQLKMLSSSESLSCLNLDSERTTSEELSDDEMRAPPKPKRSTSLNLGGGGGRSLYRQRRNLPPIPLEDSPPSPPSRSTSKPSIARTLPPSTALWFSPRIKGESFPPPPTYEEIYNETCDSLPPAIPPHGLSAPSVPRRSSSTLPDTKAWESPPVPKRITSRALPKPPGPQELPDFLSNPHIIPSKTSSLGSGKQSEAGRSRRPRSLLKEATLANAASKKKKNRGSCGELGSACRNSASLLLELQKMAKAEEEEKGRSEAPRTPEATSPGQEVGLGTGWVKVEPLTDLTDPQARANLLDSMMHSSEGCSSETDEDLANHLQHNQILKAVQRNRRRRKVLLPNCSKNACWGASNSRPTILGASNMFTRYGSEEERALQEFEFLNTFPSQSDESLLNSGQMACFFGPAGEGPSPPPGPNLQYLRNKSQVFQMDLTDLRSSEPCQSQDYPLTSVPLCGISLPHSVHPPKTFVPHDRQSHSKGATCRTDFYTRSQLSRIPCYVGTGDDSVPPTLGEGGESLAVRPSPRNSLNRSTHLVPSSGSVSHFVDLHPHSDLGSTFISPIEDSNSDSNFSPADLKVLSANPPAKQMPSSIPIRYKAESVPDASDSSRMEHDYGVDTRSLCDVKAAIQRFNAKSKPNPTQLGAKTSDVSQDPTTISSTKTASRKDESKRNLAPNSTIDDCTKKQKCSTPIKAKPKENAAASSHFSKESSQPPNPSKCRVSLTRSPKSKAPNRALWNPSNKKQGPLFKKINAASKGHPCAEGKAERQTPSGARIACLRGRGKKGYQKPKKPRQKNQEESSSDGSDRGGGISGRISISDSCAELFSPFESGDEVFQYHQ